MDVPYVRLALPRDVARVAAIQARAWNADYRDLLPVVVLARVEPSAAAQWAAAVARPPTSAHHLLVALTDGRVVGFAAVAPAEPEDGGPAGVGALELLSVDPDERRAGHGSRLLAAAMDTLRIDRFTRAVCWLAEADSTQQEFLTRAGWALDGARRDLDMGTTTLTEVRLLTDVTAR